MTFARIVCLAFVLRTTVAAAAPVATAQQAGRPSSADRKQAVAPRPLRTKKTLVVMQLGEVVAQKTTIRKTPDPKGRLLARISRGEYVAVQGAKGGYYVVLISDRSKGYIPKSDVRITEYEVISSGVDPRRPTRRRIKAAHTR